MRSQNRRNPEDESAKVTSGSAEIEDETRAHHLKLSSSLLCFGSYFGEIHQKGTKECLSSTPYLWNNVITDRLGSGDHFGWDFNP